MTTSQHPPRDLFAAAVRQAVEMHDEWDSPHCFQTLTWTGEKLAVRTYATIMPDIDPPQYPKLMAGIAADELDKYPGEPAYGFLLQIESFGVAAPGPDASEEFREQFEKDRIGRTVYQRDDAVESCDAWAVDIHGRLWSAAKTRNEPDQVTEAFYQPDSPLRPGGPFIRALLAVAYATGVLGHGLPARTGRVN